MLRPPSARDAGPRTEPTDDAHDTGDETDSTASRPTGGDFAVAPYVVEGEVDCARLLDRFGADQPGDADVAAFPDPHVLLRRRALYAGRDVRRFTDAAARDGPVSVVTGRGPSGPMHLGHALPPYFAEHLRETTGAHVHVPLSDSPAMQATHVLPPQLPCGRTRRWSR